MAEAVINLSEGSGAKATHTFSRTVNSLTVQDQVTVRGLPLGATYSVNGGPGTSTANSHLLEIMAGASLNVYITRIEICQVTLASTATIDNVQFIRLTTAGSGGTAVTPLPFDTADASAGATCQVLPSSKGTEAANPLWQTAMPMVQTLGASTLLMTPYVWTWEGNLAKAIKIPAGTANGLAIKNVTAIAGSAVIVDVQFLELAY